MKFLVHFQCTNCTLQKFCAGLHEIARDEWSEAAEDTIADVAQACGIPDQKIAIQMIERVPDNPLAPLPE